MEAILKFIWGLFGSTIVQMVLASGLPAAVEWLSKKGLPKWLIDGLVAFAKAILGEVIPSVVSDAQNEIKQVKADSELSKEDKKSRVREIRSNAKREARRRCAGVACEAETKPIE